MITFEISNLKHNFCSNLIFSNCKFSLNVIFDYSLNRKKNSHLLRKLNPQYLSKFTEIANTPNYFNKCYK